MNTSHSRLMMATALAAGLIVAAPLASRAEESATVPTNPGFKSNGQINPGDTLQVPSSSIDVRKIPSPEEARAALMAPDDPNPVPGPQQAQPQPQPQPQPQQNAGGNNKTVSPQSAGGDPTTATGGQAAIGGPLSPGASAVGSSGSSGGETTGAGTKPDSRPGPIAATGQTMPEKFSSRNDVLDRVPLAAFPMKLSDQERQQIFQAVMADKTQPAADADALMPASELSTDQALNGLHPLPASLSGIAVVKPLGYVKGKNKVLLVSPSTRTVVAEITS